MKKSICIALVTMFMVTLFASCSKPATSNLTSSNASNTEITKSMVSSIHDNGMGFIKPVSKLHSGKTGYKEIRTVEELQNISSNLDGFYILMNDLDLSSVTNWEPIGNAKTPFRGIFSGNGYSISNMKINQDLKVNIRNDYDIATEGYCIGLFGYVDDGLIENLSLIDVQIDCFVLDDTLYTLCVGSISGRCASRKIEINNCYATGYINIKTSKENDDYADIYTGGLVGLMSGESILTSSYNKVNLCVNTNFSSYVGGVAGEITYNATIHDCFNAGSINVTSSDVSSMAGGIVGDNISAWTPSIWNCYNIGDVNLLSASRQAYAGGIAGRCSDQIRNCYNLGSIKANSNYDIDERYEVIAASGGIVGYNRAEKSRILFCYNRGDICASSINSSSYEGQIIGYSDNNNIGNCFQFNNEKTIGNLEIVNDKIYKYITILSSKENFVSSYDGWDFNEVWKIDSSINDGFPYIKNLHIE